MYRTFCQKKNKMYPTLPTGFKCKKAVLAVIIPSLPFFQTRESARSLVGTITSPIRLAITVYLCYR